SCICNRRFVRRASETHA
ncbi:hypothetical protein VCHENC02_4946B, partial [Vibrio harveyi]